MAKKEDLLNTLAEIFCLRKNKLYKVLDDRNEEDNSIRKEAASYIDKLNESNKSLAYYEYTFKESRDYIIDVLRKKNYSPEVPENIGTPDNPKYKKTKSTGLKNIPYELKILIWFMAYRAIEIYNSLADKTDADAKIRAFTKEIFNNNQRVMKGISNQFMLNIFLVDSQRVAGYEFSKKTFQDFAMSPSRYYEATHYNEIEMINTYAGEKKEITARVLRYIVSFARDYDNFLDLFGGSGRASMVVPKIDGVDYYINEWDFRNINYYTVMMDDNLYAQLRSYFERVQNLLKTSDTPKEDSWEIYRNSLALLDKFFEEYNSDDKQTYDISGRVLKEVIGNKKVSSLVRDSWHQALPSVNMLKYNNMPDTDKVELAFAFIYKYSFTGSGSSSMENESMNSTKIDNFCNYDLSNLDLAHKAFARITRIYNADALYYSSFILDNFINKPSSKYIDYAEEIMALQNGEQVDYIDDTLKQLINSLGGTENKPPRKFRTLLYSDSPYLHTSGYGDKTGGKKKNIDGIYADGTITPQSMKKLIMRIMSFYDEGNDFIFSCRAGKSKQAGYLKRLDNKLKKKDSSVATLESMGITKLSDIFDVKKRSDENHSIFFDSIKIKDTSQDATASLIADLRNIFATNYAIYDVVFYSFEALAHVMNRPLYVLVSLKEGVDLKELLVELQSIEVFITSIETPSLPLGLVDDTKYRFEVYTISEFNDILRNNMLMSLYSKGWKLKPYADYSDSPDGKIYKQRTRIVVSEAELAQKEKEVK